MILENTEGNDDLLGSIFSVLNVVELTKKKLVCRRWRKLITTVINQKVLPSGKKPFETESELQEAALIYSNADIIPYIADEIACLHGWPIVNWNVSSITTNFSGAINYLMEGVLVNDRRLQLECTKRLRVMLRNNRENSRRKANKFGLVPKFVEFLDFDDNPELQMEATKALKNIASESNCYAQVVTIHGAVPKLCRLLLSPNDKVCENAGLTLLKIADKSLQLCDLVLRSKIMVQLLQLLKEKTELSVLRVATWLLCVIYRPKNESLIDFERVKAVLPTLGYLILSEDDTILVSICSLLKYLTYNPKKDQLKYDQTQMVLDTGIIEPLVALLQHTSQRVQTAALRTIRYLVSGNESLTQIVLKANLLPSLSQLLSSNTDVIKSEACHIISNIVTVGNKDHIQAIIDNNMTSQLIHISSSIVHPHICKTSLSTLYGIISGGNAEQINTLVLQGCISLFCDVLKDTSDRKLVYTVLDGLENIMQSGRNYNKMNDRHKRSTKYILKVEEVKTIQDFQIRMDSQMKQKCNRILWCNLIFHGIYITYSVFELRCTLYQELVSMALIQKTPVGEIESISKGLSRESIESEVEWHRTLRAL